MNRDKIKLAIVDDHPIVIQGLEALLSSQQEIELVGSFTNGTDFMNNLVKNNIDVVLLDIMLPDINGVDLCKKIKTHSPKTCILALSNHTERSLIMQILQNGASGYMLKNAPVTELVNGIHAAMNGEIAFSQEVKEIISRPSVNQLMGRPQITKREKQILKLVAEGKTTAVIAEELFLSPLTVETHRRNLMQKFDVRNSAELVKIAMEQLLLL